MRELSCDVAVIGAGTAGITAHRAAREAGAHAVLIEAGPGGTTCARVGCMPSKLLTVAGRAAHEAREAHRFGVRVPRVEIDGPAVLGHLREERDRFVRLVLEGLDELPADARLAGRARFLDGGTLAVDDHTRLRFRAAVIATGSSPSLPKPLEGLGARVLTTDTVFEIADLPGSLAVLGGGPVGIEIAQAMARLGVAVSLFDVGHTLAGLTHPELTRAAVEIFGAEIALHLDTEVTGAEPDGDGVRLSFTRPDGSRGSARVDRVLAAAGRPPNLKGLALEAAGLRRDAHGMPEFDARSLRCKESPVFIAGDANAVRPILHEAARQGRIVGRNAAALAVSGAATAPEPWTALAMVYTQPETASVGAPYDAEAGTSRVTGAAGFRDQGRARIEQRNRGGLRIWADRRGVLLGAEMIGPDVEHLAHLLAFAIEDGATAERLRDRPYYHPTVEEGFDSALAEITRGCGGGAG